MSKVLQGIGLSPGVAKGKVVFAMHIAPTKGSVASQDFTTEVRRFFKAVSSAKKDLELMKARISKGKIQKEVFDVIDVYLMFLDDPTLADFVVESIRQGNSAEKALEDYFSIQIERLRNTTDRYLKERVKDLKYIKRFLLNKLYELEIDWKQIAQRGEILVTHFLSPVDVVQVAEKGIKGIIVEKGSETSHTSIVARSVSIPMIKLPEATELLEEGQLVLVDGISGRVVVDPAPEDIKETVQVLATRREVEELPVELYANVDFPEEAKVVKKLGAKGIGIFRTEYIYLIEKDWPSENVQLKYLEKLLRFVDDDISVTVRIADLGGEKIPVYAEHMREELDYRGIRFFMIREDLFRTHTRAILKAFFWKRVKAFIAYDIGRVRAEVGKKYY